MIGTGSPTLLAPTADDIRLQRTPQPAVIVIFGATGDLTSRKLLPGLYSLAVQQLLPPETAIVGAARTALADDEFRAMMREGVEKHSRIPVDDDIWEGFARRLMYVTVPFTEEAGYRRLAEVIAGKDRDQGTRGNRLFYLATAPEYFPIIAENLGKVGLADEGDGARFARLVVEKPFGQDLQSARELNARLQHVFRERQVYRIDHYLGKETVQNLLVLRFGNAIFEPIWNRRYVDHVQITVAEDLGVGTRGGYYDESGALRDIVQNHMLQVLSIIAMEPPARFESRDVRDEKVKVLRAIPPFDDPAVVRRETVRGQYGPGWIGGERVPSYREERGVDPESNTETFVAMRVTVDNWRWSGTPFYLRTGKRLPRRATEVAIQFKPAPHLPFATTAVETVQPNLLILRIQPDEGASLRFLAKVPGPQLDMRSVSMDFAYGSSFLRGSPEAYERLLLDALLGDSTLFARWDEVERAWEIMEGVIREWHAHRADFPNYEAGTWGPPAADELIARDGHVWRRL